MKAPPYPMLPRRGPRPLVIGNANDVAAQAPTGFISTAIGSFDAVTGVTSETGQINATGSQVADAYSLQLNTNFFPTVDCSGAVGSSCQGWEQFVFANDGTTGWVFIQYWLIQYNTTCPPGAGWTQFSFPGSTAIYCYKNSANASSVPNQPIANLANLSLGGSVSATGDSYFFSTGNQVYSGTGDNAVDAAAGWTEAEFNVFGDAGGGVANFNSGSTLVPRTRVTYGGTAPCNCVAQGFTGETNNLDFGPTAPSPSGPGPAMLWTESNNGGVIPNCQAATTVGDTHLMTFGGLLYDFQATGDFVLAEVDPDFIVETRQVSGAPTWPNTAVNAAVATRMGSTRVVVCLGPVLHIDGKTANLPDGSAINTAGGVVVWRRGNVYSIISEDGNSVRAAVNSGWIDVAVGLGRWPATVRGLLANAKANGNVMQIAARDGRVLTSPFGFADLYGRYGDSWRVSPRDSLLAVCGAENVERANPTRPFYASALDPKVYARARAFARAAGVKMGALLDAATLDVAVIGDSSAAQVFARMRAPVAVGKIVRASRSTTR